MTQPAVQPQKPLPESSHLALTAEDLTLLFGHRLLSGLPEQAIFELLTHCSVIFLNKGDILLSPRAENHHLYLLLTGHLLVYLDAVGSPTSFPIGPGELIGEMSIIEQRKTSAYVVAHETSRLVAVHETQFWDKVGCYPDAMRSMLQMFSERMRKQNEVIRRVSEQQLKYEHLQRELAAAGNIQANILPQEFPLFPDHPQVDVFALMQPARQVGGDFYDAFALDDEHIYVAVGDVSGKGLPAALFMVRAITLLRMTLSKKKRFHNVLPKMNEMLCENNKDFTFLTLMVAMLNVKTGALHIVNGGHNAPLLAAGERPFIPLPVPKGALLGVSEKIIFEVAEYQMNPGDTLFLYTDGVTECENERQHFFSVGQMQAVLNTAVPPRTPLSLVTQLRQSLQAFAQGVPQSDDITMLALTYLGDNFHKPLGKTCCKKRRMNSSTGTVARRQWREPDGR
jgi:phosphoserine phosphatase RsbU/P